MNQLPQTPHHDLHDMDDMAPVRPRPARKPRILIAGEFSAGKTRLINGLLGDDLLPSNVTATALPPIWLVGDRVPSQRIDLDGTATPLPQTGRGLGADLAAGVGPDISETAFCLVSHPAPILSRIDLIDTPGNSDPNMPAEAWQRMLGHADAVLWCSHAVQAWRQSEKAVWSEMPPELLPGGTLLITQADRLTDPENVRKVHRRVQREAGPMFETIMMVSLIRDEDLARITDHLVALAARLEALPGAEHPAVSAAIEAAPGSQPVRIRRRVRAVTDILPEAAPALDAPAAAHAPVQAPVRVAPQPLVQPAAQTPVQAHAQTPVQSPAQPFAEPEADSRPVMPVRVARREGLRVIEGRGGAERPQDNGDALREALRAEAAPPPAAAAPSSLFRPDPARDPIREALREPMLEPAPLPMAEPAFEDDLDPEAFAPPPETDNRFDWRFDPREDPEPEARQEVRPEPRYEARPEPRFEPNPARTAPPRLPPLLLTQRSQAREIWDRVAAGRTLYEADAVSEALEAYFDEIDREFRRLAPTQPRPALPGQGDPASGF